MTAEELIRGLKEAIDLAHKNYDSLNAAYQAEKRKNERLLERLRTASAVNIVTAHIKPPIPIKDYDWSAVRYDYDEGDPVGHGATEAEAVANLIEQEQDRED